MQLSNTFKFFDEPPKEPHREIDILRPRGTNKLTYLCERSLFSRSRKSSSIFLQFIKRYFVSRFSGLLRHCESRISYIINQRTHELSRRFICFREIQGSTNTSTVWMKCRQFVAYKFADKIRRREFTFACNQFLDLEGWCVLVRKLRFNLLDPCRLFFFFFLSSFVVSL